MTRETVAEMTRSLRYKARVTLHLSVIFAEIGGA